GAGHVDGSTAYFLFDGARRTSPARLREGAPAVQDTIRDDDPHWVGCRDRRRSVSDPAAGRTSQHRYASRLCNRVCGGDRAAPYATGSTSSIPHAACPARSDPGYFLLRGPHGVPAARHVDPARRMARHRAVHLLWLRPVSLPAAAEHRSTVRRRGGLTARFLHGERRPGSGRRLLLIDHDTIAA